jgi:hypothetical protein
MGASKEGCWIAAPLPPNRKLKITDFVDTKILNVLL